MFLTRIRKQLEKVQRRIVIIEELQDRLLQVWLKTARQAIPDARVTGSVQGLKTPHGIRSTVHAELKFHQGVMDSLEGVAHQTGTTVDEMVQRIVYRALGFKSGEED